MSWNLRVEGRDDHGQSIHFQLVRASRGITHSASIATGDEIQFPNGVSCQVGHVVHHWTPQNHPAAPNSVAYATLDQNLSTEQIRQMREYGFEPA